MSSLNNKENLNPAVIHNEDSPNEMSAEEFQRTLITWFEDRGLLSELRAHLRRKMIGILKETKLGKSTSKTNSKISPKTHVINLLVAEFLLKHRYHYSLSVFSTEVPFFISILPEFSSSFINPNVNNEANTVNNFSQQNFWDILETLGFSPEIKETKKLHELYFNSSENSLLACMVGLLAKNCKLKAKLNTAIEGTSENVNQFEPWLKEIHDLLIHYDVQTNHVDPLREQLKVIFEREHVKIKSEENIKYNNRQVLINQDINLREREIQRLITQMENTYFKEREKMTKDLTKEQEQLEDLKKKVKQQKFEYEFKNENIIKREEILKQRETELDEQLGILKSRMNIMQNVYDSIIEENKKINQIRQELQQQGQNSEEIYKKLHEDYEVLRLEIQTTKKIIEKFSESEIQYVNREQQTVVIEDNPEEQLLKGILDRVQNENAALRLLNTEQQRRLDDISVQNSVLLNDLENCQATINLLSRTNSQRGMITVPPLLPSAPMPTRSRPQPASSLNGGGENLGFVPQPPSPPVYRYAYSHQFRDYFRRKTPKRVAQTHGSSSLSSSPTEDILQEARQRLRRLEEESEEVDRQYRAFRERQSHENFVTLQQPFAVNNIPESILRIRSNEPNRRTYPAIAINVNSRPTFAPNTIDHPASQSYLRGGSSQSGITIAPISVGPNRTSTTSAGKVTIPGTSYEFAPLRRDGAHHQTPVGAQEAPEAAFQETGLSPGQSPASSRISHLQNLSISSVEISSDNSDASENEEIQ